ncbi:MAG: ferrochelatase [Legionellaceae bacterium]|nr:ferrochelatase [Legionellaceae bacterium]
MKKGLLLLNLGTPDSPEVPAVRRYLAEFLSDYRVIDLPAPLRYLLLYAFILPFRPRQSAHAYQAIWRPEGSPLLLYSQSLSEKVQSQLGSQWQVALGMRYGTPSIASAVAALQDCASITVLPLFPQYSSAATGSAIEKTLHTIQQQRILPNLQIIRDFCTAPAFIEAQAALLRPLIAHHEHLLFSFHGIPERHLTKEGCQPVCPQACPALTLANQACYRAQCYATARALAKALALTETQYSVAFQSRLGKTPWIQPYTDAYLPELAQGGIKNILVSCPSFVADCLETLEEIGMRAKAQWQSLGGEKLTLAPCVNDSALWVEGLVKLVTAAQLDRQGA